MIRANMSVNSMRFDFSKLNQPIEIHEMKTVTENGVPQKPESVLFLRCFAHAESVSLKDYETSVQTGTQYQIKVFIRNNPGIDRKSTRLNSSHVAISYAVFCLK